VSFNRKLYLLVSGFGDYAIKFTRNGVNVQLRHKSNKQIPPYKTKPVQQPVRPIPKLVLQSGATQYSFKGQLLSRCHVPDYTLPDATRQN